MGCTNSTSAILTCSTNNEPTAKFQELIDKECKIRLNVSQKIIQAIQTGSVKKVRQVI